MTRSHPRPSLPLLAGLVLVLVLSAAGTSSARVGAGAGATSTCDPTSIAVVVDFGDAPDAPDLSVTCVPFSEGMTGADVLAARHDASGEATPRYDPSGLLCGIDGFPASGCGEQTETGYIYWSYWLGTPDGWEHAEVGPGFRDADPSVTEGWHYVEASGMPTDPPPGAESDADAVRALVASSPAPTATPLAGDDAGTGGGALDAGESDDSGGLLTALVGAAAVVAIAAAGFVVARKRRAA